MNWHCIYHNSHTRINKTLTKGARLATKLCELAEPQEYTHGPAGETPCPTGNPRPKGREILVWMLEKA